MRTGSIPEKWWSGRSTKTIQKLKAITDSMRKNYSKNQEKFYRDILRTLFSRHHHATCIWGHHHANCFWEFLNISKNSHTDTFQSHQTAWLDRKYKVKFYLHKLMTYPCMKVNKSKIGYQCMKVNKIENWRLFTEKVLFSK